MADLEIMQEITIELDGKSPFSYIVVKQGDKGSRIIAITLLQNKQPYTIQAGCIARIKYFKPDGNPVINDCVIQNNKILVTYTEQMLAAAGTAKGEVLILQGDRELKSATYYTKIVEAVFGTDGVVSDKEFLSMAKILVEVDQAGDKATENARIAKAAADATNAAIAEADTATSNANEATAAATTAKNNADAATQNANTKATAAGTAATRAEAAAAACEGIAAGINTIVDSATGYTYTIGIEGGRMYLERRN